MRECSFHDPLIFKDLPSCNLTKKMNVRLFTTKKVLHHPKYEGFEIQFYFANIAHFGHSPVKVLKFNFILQA